MKRITLLLMVLLGTKSYAQFFEQTSYRGAFGGQSSINWTAGWCNWDPESIAYPATTSTVSADITSNTTWATGSVVLLKNKVYVTNGATLTIQPGVIIRGDKATEGTLIISKGSKIMAQGTSANPIVFTSNFDNDGSRAHGDWGGIVILGNAVNNQGTVVVEGGLDPVKAAFGGTNDADNSGIFSYVRIEFAGFPFQPDKEINGLTLGSVGSGTKLDHIQVSFCNDDAFEWFGGTVNAKYLVSYRNIDDDFDTDFGFRGKVQYGLIVRDPDMADQCSCSTSEGFESDNDGTGTAASPLTSAIFSNITAIGPYRGNTANAIDSKHKRALRIRRNSSISIYNSIFTDWPTGLHIDGTSSETNATSGGLTFKSNVLAGMAVNHMVNTGSTFDIASFFTSNNNSSYTSSSSVMFVNAYPDLDITPDYRLASGSPLLTGADFTDSKLGTVLSSISNLNTDQVISLFPNPSINGEITIAWPATQKQVVIAVTDISGKIVANYEVENRSEITLQHGLNAGIYFISINTSEYSEIKKVIIQ